MNARSLLAFAAALPLFLCTVAAHAEDSSQETFERSHPILFRSGASYLKTDHDGLEFQRADMFMGVSYDWSPRLTLFGDIHYGTTRFGYRSSIDDTLTIDARFSTPLDVSASTGLALHLMQQGPFWADLDGEVEASVFNSSPRIKAMTITTPQGTFDVAPYAQRQSVLATSWYRVTFGTTLGLRLGIVEPRLSLAFEYAHANMDVGLTRDSRDTLSVLGHDSGSVESPHQAAFFHALVSPGVDVRLGRRDLLGFTGSFAPGSTIDSFGLQLLFKHRF